MLNCCNPPVCGMLLVNYYGCMGPHLRHRRHRHPHPHHLCHPPHPRQPPEIIQIKRLNALQAIIHPDRRHRTHLDGLDLGLVFGSHDSSGCIRGVELKQKLMVTNAILRLAAPLFCVLLV